MRALFIYPDFGEPDGFPEYAAHSGQVVEVGKEVQHECDTDDRLFCIFAPDGWHGHAWESELQWVSHDECKCGRLKSVEHALCTICDLMERETTCATR